MRFSLTELRTNLYKIIDKIIETGEPLEIERKGYKIKISLENEKTPKLQLLINRSHIIKDSNLFDTPWTWENTNEKILKNFSRSVFDLGSVYCAT